MTHRLELALQNSEILEPSDVLESAEPFEGSIEICIQNAMRRDRFLSAQRDHKGIRVWHGLMLTVLDWESSLGPGFCGADQRQYLRFLDQMPQ